MRSFIITGTDTGVGKTVVSSLLMASIPDLFYWKPVQSGTLEGTDTEAVVEMSGCSPHRTIQERYTFTQPRSPHLASELDGKHIDTAEFRLPPLYPLLIEGAGGVLVPLNSDTLFIDLFEIWSLPVIVVTRSTLGTINHTLLTLEALRARKIEVAGCIVVGPIDASNEQAIMHYGAVKILGRVPMIQPINADTLKHVYQTEFHSFTKEFSG